MGMDNSDNQALVTYHREDHVGYITLNRPDKRNAMNLALWDAVGAAVVAAGADVEARVIILRGAGKCFCAGLDLSPDNELIAMLTGPAGATQKMTFYRTVRRLQGIHQALERLPQPVIAAIHGPCLGAGLELALCADIRVCSSDAVFGLPEAKLAIITDVGGLQRLPRAVGPGHAREIAFRGNRFGAERALAVNLVNDVYPDKDMLDAKVREMALEIAGNPPLAVQGAKECFLFDEGMSSQLAQDYNGARSSMIMPSEDLFEAMSAYLQKRQGAFKGA